MYDVPSQRLFILVILHGKKILVFCVWKRNFWIWWILSTLSFSLFITRQIIKVRMVIANFFWRIFVVLVVNKIFQSLFVQNQSILEDFYLVWFLHDEFVWGKNIFRQKSVEQTKINVFVILFIHLVMSFYIFLVIKFY